MGGEREIKTITMPEDNQPRPSLELAEVQRPNIPRRICDNHDIVWCLMGLPCPRCKRISLLAYDYGS